MLLILAGTVLGALYFTRDMQDDTHIFVRPERGAFEVVVGTGGELRARNSYRVMGPRAAMNVGIFSLRILDMVPEGTYVQEGDYVAQLDLTDLHTRMQDVELDVKSIESRLEQAQLDSSLTLNQTRFSIQNLEFQLEEREIELEQSIYESPAVQRQARIDLERTQRQLEQERQNLQTRTRQAEARMREILAERNNRLNLLRQINELEEAFTIRAPREGMVVNIRTRWARVTMGSNVNIQNPAIAEMPDFGSMESVTYINEVDIRSIERGQPVTVYLDAEPDKVLSGVVSSVANIGEQRSGTDARVFEVVVEINEYDPELRPSMTTRNDIMVQSEDDALYIPLETVHRVDEYHYVFRKNRRGGLIMQQVILGAINRDHAIALAGVADDDELLISMAPDYSEMQRTMLPEEEIEKYREELERLQDEEMLVDTPEEEPQLPGRRPGGQQQRPAGAGPGASTQF